MGVSVGDSCVGVKFGFSTPFFWPDVAIPPEILESGEKIDLDPLSVHPLMMVKRVNRYLNKGLKIMANKCGTVQIMMEAILLLLYAWNSAPIPGTDLSRCFVTLGREF